MKKSIQIVAISVILSCATSLKGQWTWASKSSSSNYEIGKDIAIDNNGNSYVTGEFITSANFGMTSLLATSGGNTGGFLAKTDASGAFVWAIKMDGTVASRGRAVATNGNDVFVAGQFNYNITLRSTNSTNIVLTGPSNGTPVNYLAKYNSNGVVQWAQMYSPGSPVDVADIAISDAQQRIYVIGTNPIVQSYNYSGTLMWTKNLVGGSKGYGVAADAAGNIHCIFNTNSGSNNGVSISNSPAFNLPVGSGDRMFLCKLDVSGNFIWGQLIGSAITLVTEEPSESLGLDAAGNVYISGKYAGGSANISGIVLPASLINSYQSGFVAKYSNLGTIQWAKKIGSTTSTFARAHTTDMNGNTYVASFLDDGIPSNNVSIGNCFSFSSYPFSQNPSPNNKIFVTKYNTLGNVDWAVSGGFLFTTDITSIAENKKNGAVITGHISGNAIFGNTSLTHSGGSDAFVARIDAQPQFNAITPICAGNAISLSPVSPSNANFNWYTTLTGGTPFFIGVNYTTPILYTTTTYYLSMILPNGCESVRIPVTITVLGSTANAGPDKTICKGSCTTIGTVANEDETITYSWSILGGGVISNANSSQLNVCPSSNTTYILTVSSSITGCISSDAVTVTVDDISANFTLVGTLNSANNYFTLFGSPTNANVSGVVGFGQGWYVDEVVSMSNLTAVAGSSLHNPTCWWFSNFTNDFNGYDGPYFTSTGLNPLHLGCGNPNPGRFTAGHAYLITRGVWSNACPYKGVSQPVSMGGNGNMERTSDNTSITLNATEPNSFNYSLNANSKIPFLESEVSLLTIFPNPNKGVFGVSFAKPISGIVRIYDVLGKIVKSFEVDKESESVKLDLSSYHKGIYTLVLNNGENTQTQKIIIE